MNKIIKNFNKQFSYEPKIENADALKKFGKFLIVGMGGSGLAGGLLKTWNPCLDIVLHNDYGLPALPEDYLKNCLIVANSYSGNTEEVISAFEEAGKKGYALAAIAAEPGGKLLELAKKESVPFVAMPDGIPPRSAIGYSFRALLALIGESGALKESGELAKSFNPSEFEEQGKKIAKLLRGKIPTIYASNKNAALAYNWKIRFNENSKSPAFSNLLPEVNHNEMAGFDGGPEVKELSQKFHFIFLKDYSDDEKIIKRMDILAKLYQEKGLPVSIIDMNQNNIFERIFSSIILADWTSYYLAKEYGVDPEKTPMIEEFKRLMK